MNVATIASYVLYFTAGFVFLPAGRDIVSHKTAILPGESDMRKAMTMTKVGTRTFMWGVWVRASRASRPSDAMQCNAPHPPPPRNNLPPPFPLQ